MRQSPTRSIFQRALSYPIVAGTSFPGQEQERIPPTENSARNADGNSSSRPDARSWSSAALNAAFGGGIHILQWCTGRPFIPSCALIAERHSLPTEIPGGSTAPTSAISAHAITVVHPMGSELFWVEREYQATMAIARSMLEDMVITDTEYSAILGMMLEKYNPVLGWLIAEFPLTF